MKKAILLLLFATCFLFVATSCEFLDQPIQTRPDASDPAPLDDATATDKAETEPSDPAEEEPIRQAEEPAPQEEEPAPTEEPKQDDKPKSETKPHITFPVTPPKPQTTPEEPAEKPGDPPSEEPIDPPSEEPSDPPSEEPTEPQSEDPDPSGDPASDPGESSGGVNLYDSGTSEEVFGDAVDFNDLIWLD